jgi:hypothetical protein
VTRIVAVKVDNVDRNRIGCAVDGLDFRLVFRRLNDEQLTCKISNSD